MSIDDNYGQFSYTSSSYEIGGIVMINGADHCSALYIMYLYLNLFLTISIWTQWIKFMQSLAPPLRITLSTTYSKSILHKWVFTRLSQNIFCWLDIEITWKVPGWECFVMYFSKEAHFAIETRFASEKETKHFSGNTMLKYGQMQCHFTIGNVGLISALMNI